ncbi:MAG TPA: exodeoxyribonuclease VII small subunit [Angustibacter sp.]|nr:exodeoxyribonuclease VII small subunit [Angustibacter sp.]
MPAAKKKPTADPLEELSYEQARDELLDVVRRLEAGGTSLEESLALWERGEALADRCQRWLDGARARLDRARGTGSDAGEDDADEDAETE